MKAIWKYELQIVARQAIDMPPGARVLHVDNQRGSLCLWAFVTPGPETERRIFHVIGTGHPIEDTEGIKHVGSVVIDPFVWHAFEELPI